ncbi:MAG: nitroreductase family protein [Prevotellaceae bacterium]|jgi:nitroreductase|nr:nitroreductase family protein [Prevotellaceae bacterium]
MNFEELILKRQSDRQYDTSRPVEDEKLNKCIEAARLAPSACNAQPWKFIALRDPEIRAKVGQCAASMGMNKFCLDAPMLVVLVLEKPNLTSKIGSVLKNKEYTLIDVGITAAHFCLQATELGLGSCIVGWFDEKKIRKLLGIPSSKRIPLLICAGYPASPQRPKIRKDLEKIYSTDKY